MRRAFAFLAACLLLLAGQAAPAGACTLWSAVGDAAGGGTLLAKNRDNAPEQTDALILVRPETGLACVGLFATVNGRERLVAGVNEAGLSVVSATAGGVPKALRDGPSRVKGLLGRVLSECRSLEDVLSRREWFAGHSPVIYMVSDHTGAAWIEVGPADSDGGNVAVRRAASGALSHTNHYLSEELAGQNTRIGASSAARLARIQALLTGPAAAYTLEDFLRMSRDQSAGPDDSIFRTGGTPRSTRTLATVAVRTPATGAPVLDVSGFEKPGEPWHVRLVLDDGFWEQVSKGAMKTLAPNTSGNN